MRRGQISFEYMMIMGFITFVLVGILAYAYSYGNEVEDKIRMTQITNYGNKVTTSAESVFYSGEPSKLTIEVYLPDGVKNITIQDNSVYMTIATSTGTNVLSFDSNVPISGSLIYTNGLKKIELVATSSEVVISQA